MKNLILVLIAFTALVLSGAPEAKLKGKSVIFVHGLQPFAYLPTNPLLPTFRDDQETREEDAKAQAGAELKEVVDLYLFYHSGLRLDQNLEDVMTLVKEIELSGDCENGCYFITASTGDLVTRKIIEQLDNPAWNIDRSKFWVIASFDLVGAGGGTELGDVGVALLENNRIAKKIKEVIDRFAPREFWAAGMGHNLRPTVARATARQNKSVPRLRIAGRGIGPYSIVSEPILFGGDDGTVPLHSACGSSRIEAIYSCSNKREMGGKNVAWTLGASRFMHNHYPILMARDMHHTQSDYKGIIVPLNNNRLLKGENDYATEVSFAEKVERVTTGHWWWKKTTKYTYVKRNENENDKTLARYFIDEFK